MNDRDQCTRAQNKLPQAGVTSEVTSTMIRKSVVLLMVDVGQVLRVMVSTKYGWSVATAAAVRWCDIVYISVRLVSMVIPRYSFFILAVTVVAIALLDTAYVAKLFRGNHVDKVCVCVCVCVRAYVCFALSFR